MTKLFQSFKIGSTVFFLLMLALFGRTGHGQPPYTKTIEDSLFLTDGIDTFNLKKDTVIKKEIIRNKISLSLAKGANNDTLFAEISGELGDLYVKYNDLDSAKHYYILSLNKFVELGKPYDIAQNNMLLGNIGIVQNDNFTAFNHYQRALAIAEEENFIDLQGHLQNNLGILYLRIDEYDDANKYFAAALEDFQSLKDTYNSALAYSNLAEIEKTLHNDSSAIGAFLDAIRLLSTEEQWVDMSNAYNSIAEIHYENGDYAKALQYSNLAISTFQHESRKYEGPTSYVESAIKVTASLILYELGRKVEALEIGKQGLVIAIQNQDWYRAYRAAKIIGEIYEQNGDAKTALKYFKGYANYYQTYESNDDLVEVSKVKLREEFKAKIAEAEAEKEKLQLKHRNQEITLWAIIIISTLILAVLVSLYYYTRIKAQKIKLQRNNLRLEKESLSKELQYKNKELSTKMMYVVEKNEFIGSIAKKLMEFKSNTTDENKAVIQSLVKELERNTSEKVWEEFEIRFTEVNKEFMKALSQKHPDLSPNERKLCAFLKLNMSTKEISSITHQSVKTLNMARFRLRKKLNMEKDENLIAYLNQIQG